MLFQRALMAAASSSGITPDDVASLYAWYRADLGVTGSAPVTAWADQSGNSRHLASTHGDPSTTTTANGQAAIDFDGNDGIYRSSALSQALPVHLFMVIRVDAFNTASARLFQLDEGASSSHPLIMTTSSTARCWTNGNDRVTIANTPTAGTWALVQYVATTTVTRGAWNDDAYSSSGAVTNSVGIGGVALAGEGAGGSNFINCAIAECAIYSADYSGDSATLAGLKAYFNDRYALW